MRNQPLGKPRIFRLIFGIRCFGQAFQRCNDLLVLGKHGRQFGLEPVDQFKRTDHPGSIVPVDKARSKPNGGSTYSSSLRK